MDREALIRAIYDLPLLERAVFLMHRREDLTYDQIGRCLGMSAKDVEIALASGLTILCRQMYGM